MFVTRVKLVNWLNFRSADVPLRETTFVLGANASGKSNFLEVFRFLRDVSKPQGGGLQKAIADRGGIPKIRCLHARKQNEIRIEVHLSENPDQSAPDWKYILSFKPEGKGAQRVLVETEQVWKNGDRILSRPQVEDEEDTQRLTETYLEQTRANGDFRDLASFFSSIKYLHLIPQLLKHPELGIRQVEGDPFGQSFLESVAKTTSRTREARLRKIEIALKAAVPQFTQLRFDKDPNSGAPHLEAKYSHYRPNAGWQREDQFSDGTLRLIGLLWSLLDGDSLLLLAEPELSLNDSVVREIPLLLDQAQRSRKVRRQVIVSTHSDALLSNRGIDGRRILLIESTDNGSTVRTVDSTEEDALRSGLSVAEVILPKTRPPAISQLALFE